MSFTRARPLRHFIPLRGPALAGVIGPIVFWSVLVVLGQTQPAYSAARQRSACSPWVPTDG